MSMHTDFIYSEMARVSHLSPERQAQHRTFLRRLIRQPDETIVSLCDAMATAWAQQGDKELNEWASSHRLNPQA